MVDILPLISLKKGERGIIVFIKGGKNVPTGWNFLRMFPLVSY